MREFDKWLARVLLLNSALTAGVVFGWLGEPQQGAAQVVLVMMALLGALSAAMALRGWRAGWWGGMLYYGLQVFSYFPSAQDWSYSVKAGLNVGLVLHLPHGQFVINLLASALLLATVWPLRRARRSGQA